MIGTQFRSIPSALLAWAHRTPRRLTVARPLGIAAALALAIAGCGQPPASQNSSTPPQVTPAPASPATTTPLTPPSRDTSSATANADSGPVYHLPHAQPKLPTVKLWIGAKSVDAELCTTLQQIATGQMFRKEIRPDDPMLFVFGSARRREFYMKNVPFDIAAAYITPDGVIDEIVQLKKQNVQPVPSRSSNIQFVLETDPEWFTRNGFGPGTLIKTDRGDLKDTLARRAQLP